MYVCQQLCLLLNISVFLSIYLFYMLTCLLVCGFSDGLVIIPVVIHRGSPWMSNFGLFLVLQPTKQHCMHQSNWQQKWGKSLGKYRYTEVSLFSDSFLTSSFVRLTLASCSSKTLPYQGQFPFCNLTFAHFPIKTAWCILANLPCTNEAAW